MKERFLLLLSLVALIGYSCTKERSCENCKENKPPIALAGPDQVITLPTDSVLLNGTNSSDPDGTISSFIWTRISGPASLNIHSPASSKTSVKNLVPGVYQFELKVTDNGGLSAKDTLQVTVIDPGSPNRPPVANAGIDQTITLPVNSGILDGSASTDPDNNITAYAWKKISGPTPFNITNSNVSQTQATGLIEGVYEFELKVTDIEGLVGMDTIRVIVVQPSPPCTDCKIVFVSDRNGNTEIYSCNVDGSGIRRLTNHPGIDDQPAWSPDGTQIAFISDRSGKFEIYTMNADGSAVRRRTFAEREAYHPAWSPDGTKILFSAVSSGSLNIWELNTTTEEQKLLFAAPGFDGNPAWSPDGTKIAFVSDWEAYDFVYDIYTINADGTGFTALTGDIFDDVDYLQPSWSPAGTKLAVAIRQTTGADLYTQIGLMNANGSGITVISSGAWPWTTTSWSGDGTRIVYTSLFELRKDVSWVAADGSAGGIIVTNGWNADWKK